MRITCALIMECVSEYYGCTVDDITSMRRSKGVVLPRHVAMWLAKTMTNRSFVEVGRYMGDRDHTSIIHAVGSINKERDASPILQQALDELQVIIEAAASTLTIVNAPLPDDIDAVSVANRLINAPLTRLQISIHELNALASFTVASARRDAAAAAAFEFNQVREAHHKAAMDAALEAQRTQLLQHLQPERQQAVKQVLTAYARFENNQFTRDEQASRRALEAALTGLKHAYEPQNLKELNL